MKTKRKRCLFCSELVDDQKAHVISRHFPRHCTVCLKTMDSHPKTLSSPAVTIPCEGALFVPGDAR